MLILLLSTRKKLRFVNSQSAVQPGFLRAGYCLVPGCCISYRAFLAQLANKPVLHEQPEQVHKAAAHDVETLAVNSMQMFCRVLGSFAGNLTLTLGALGGVYIAGGIALVSSFLESSEFRYRFESRALPLYLMIMCRYG